MLIDIHTHQSLQTSEGTSVLNYMFQNSYDFPQNQYFSLSIHPWYLNQVELIDWGVLFEQLKKNTKLIAIGECGLDKNTSFSLDFQISILNQNYILAKKLKKPMIIHCVAAFNELLHWKKDKNEVTMLVHGFVKKKELLNSLLKAGFYVSFGLALLKETTSLKASFESMPLDKLLLETDDQDNLTIEDIYLKAASIKNMDVKILENQIESNFNNFITNNGNAC